MKTKTKVLLITGGALLLSGIIVVLVTFIIKDFNINNFGFERNITTEIKMDESFTGLRLASINCDIEIIGTDSGDRKIEYTGNEKLIPDASINSGELNIDLRDKLEWYDEILNLSRGQKLVITVPVEEMKDVTIRGTSGNLYLKNIKLSGQLNIVSNSGNVSLEQFDAADMLITINSGNLNAELVTGKNFDIDTASGDVNAPKSLLGGGSCVVNTSSGNVNISYVK